MTTIALVLASVALAISVTVAVLLVTLMRQSAETTSDLRHHRRAHTIAHGHADPKLDRRQVNIGAPRSTGERRGATRYPEPRERYAPRPVELEDEPDLPATGELEQPDLPTSMLQRQDMPDVRDVRRRPS